MNRAEREAILGPEVLAQITARVALCPPPSPELIAELRAIFGPVIAQMHREEAERAAAGASTSGQKLVADTEPGANEEPELPEGAA